MKDEKLKLYGKLIINYNLKLLTGLHIGASKELAEIGGIDSPVVRDPENKPYIPGSSIKGKLRSLAEKKNEKEIRQNKERHECGDESCKVCRLFGSAEKGSKQRSRLIFYDAFLNKEYLNSQEDSLFESKFENSIDRITAQANPRQIERVVRGTEFKIEIVYNIEFNSDEEIKSETSLGKRVEEDLTELSILFGLLQNDYLGGSGSRGYGMVKFDDVHVGTQEIEKEKVDWEWLKHRAQTLLSL